MKNSGQKTSVHVIAKHSMARKLLLENDHVEGIQSYEVYRRQGGYRSVEKALKSMSPEAVVMIVRL